MKENWDITKGRTLFWKVPGKIKAGIRQGVMGLGLGEKTGGKINPLLGWCFKSG
jgi:hypothetical protein